mmetsp:Transcript_12372/g.41211  ORF Transcript_12372/g.41211 Transcript_12372/m.41211 type:complete len:275 (-) Transcript_12372:296-1120(-)
MFKGQPGPPRRGGRRGHRGAVDRARRGGCGAARGAPLRGGAVQPVGVHAVAVEDDGRAYGRRLAGHGRRRRRAYQARVRFDHLALGRRRWLLREDHRPRRPRRRRPHGESRAQRPDDGEALRCCFKAALRDGIPSRPLRPARVPAPRRHGRRPSGRRPRRPGRGDEPKLRTDALRSIPPAEPRPGHGRRRRVGRSRSTVARGRRSRGVLVRPCAILALARRRDGEAYAPQRNVPDRPLRPLQCFVAGHLPPRRRDVVEPRARRRRSRRRSCCCC